MVETIITRVMLVFTGKVYSLEPGGFFEFNRWWAFCFGVFDFKCRFGVSDTKLEKTWWC